MSNLSYISDKILRYAKEPPHISAQVFKANTEHLVETIQYIDQLVHDNVIGIKEIDQDYVLSGNTHLLNHSRKNYLINTQCLFD